MVMWYLAAGSLLSLSAVERPVMPAPRMMMCLFGVEAEICCLSVAISEKFGLREWSL